MTATMQTPQLSRREWSAVAIALKDAGSGGCESARRGATSGVAMRIATMLFGVRPANRLGRLEAVRQFVCASRRRRAAASELVPVLAEQGFSSAQIDALALLSL